MVDKRYLSSPFVAAFLALSMHQAAKRKRGEKLSLDLTLFVFED